MEHKYDLDNLFIKTYNNDGWFENEKPTDKETLTEKNL